VLLTGTITNSAALLHAEGAREVYACCTHAVFRWDVQRKTHSKSVGFVITANTVVRNDFPRWNVRVWVNFLDVGSVFLDPLQGINWKMFYWTVHLQLNDYQAVFSRRWSLRTLSPWRSRITFRSLLSCRLQTFWEKRYGVSTMTALWAASSDNRICGNVRLQRPTLVVGDFVAAFEWKLPFSSLVWHWNDGPVFSIL